jgi:hypothetical protein
MEFFPIIPMPSSGLRWAAQPPTAMNRGFQLILSLAGHHVDAAPRHCPIATSARSQPAPDRNQRLIATSPRLKAYLENAIAPATRSPALRGWDEFAPRWSPRP